MDTSMRIETASDWKSAQIYEEFVNISLARRPDEEDRFWRCWRRNDCGSCLSSSGPQDCGWCPYSATCVPLPSSHSTILSPINNPHICPFPWQERYELRTRPFGCNCSTTSFLVALITCVSTLVGALVLWGLVKLLIALWRVLRAGSTGYELVILEEEERHNVKGRVWRRGGSWMEWLKGKIGKGREEYQIVIE